MTETVSADVLGLTARIIAAHIGRNQVAAEDLPQLIQAVYRALSSAGAEPVATEAPRTPAVPVRRSVFPDHIVCLEDGAKMTMLKRYLQTRYNLTPAAYRERWGLPADYPMVAPNYATKRSALARRIGLGRKKAGEPPEMDVAPAAPELQAETEGGVTITKVPARRARGVKK